MFRFTYFMHLCIAWNFCMFIRKGSIPKDKYNVTKYIKSRSADSKYDKDETNCYSIFDDTFSHWLKWLMLHVESFKFIEKNWTVVEHKTYKNALIWVGFLRSRRHSFVNLLFFLCLLHSCWFVSLFFSMFQILFSETHSIHVIFIGY